MPKNKNISYKKTNFYFNFRNQYSKVSCLYRTWIFSTFILGYIALIFIVAMSYKPVSSYINPLVANLNSLKPLSTPRKSGYEVFGFAPYWTINKLDSVDFNTLTTFAYFGVPIKSDGGLERSDYGYAVFKSDKATSIFKKAHSYGTRVVLTITCMKNKDIESFLGSDIAMEKTVVDTVSEVKSRGIDGINIDVEYVGTPSPFYRKRFSDFVAKMTDRMHQEVPNSKVTVSVYASSAKAAKLYDIVSIGSSADGIFMMAYDFAVKGSDIATPTAPLYGHKEGKYNYDISTAVEDFSNQMPAGKIILGVPYYGYNYLVYGEPRVKAQTRPSGSWRGRPLTQTYQIAQNTIKPDRTGWDELGQVGWLGYYVPSTDTWRMIFLDDSRSLGIKYDFAKNKKLAGVGMWALGFDEGKTELWDVLREKFGTRSLADNRMKFAEIN